MIHFHQDGTVSVWDIRTDPSSVCVFNDHRQTIWSAKFFGENQIVTSGVDKTVRIFDVRVGRCVETISVCSIEVLVFAIQFSFLDSGRR